MSHIELTGQSDVNDSNVEGPAVLQEVASSSSSNAQVHTYNLHIC